MSSPHIIDFTRSAQRQRVPSGVLLLNGFEVIIDDEVFTAYVVEGAGSDEERNAALRAEFSGEWLLRRRGNDLHGLPLVHEPERAFGSASSMEVRGNLHLLGARLEAAIAATAQGELMVGRNPSVLAERNLLEEAISSQAGSNTGAELAKRFSVRPRFDFQARAISLARDSKLVLFLRVRTRWGLDVAVSELVEAGVDVAGLYVLRASNESEGPRILGRVSAIDGDTVFLDDLADEAPSQVDAGRIVIEPRRDYVIRLLGSLLGEGTATRVLREMDEGIAANYKTGSAFYSVLEKMSGRMQARLGRVSLASDLTAQIGGLVRVPRIMAVGNGTSYTTIHEVGQVEHCYNPARTQRDPFAWSGLQQYGPFQAATFSPRSPRILVVCTDTTKGRAEQFVQAFLQGVGDGQSFGGFASTFHLVNPEVVFCAVPWIANNGNNPGRAYKEAIERHHEDNRINEYDAALVLVHDEHADLPPNVNPYLWSKAYLLMMGVPVQQARMSTVTASSYTLTVALKNISTALYAKMGGVPWTVNQSESINDEIVIGLGLAEQGGRFGSRRRLVGITTVFRGDGNYLLGYVAGQCAYQEYPATLRRSTLEVLRRRKQNEGWQPGDTVRIVFHSYQPFRGQEIDRIVAECVAEVGQEQNIEFAFLTVTKDHPFTLLDINQEGYSRGQGAPLKGTYYPDRGLITQIGRYERLISTIGPAQSLGPDVPIAKPILIKLHRASTYNDLTYLAEQVLRFTSLSWRTVYPVRMPVTIGYSKLIAEQLGQLDELAQEGLWSPETLNAQLASKLWFL